MLLLFCGSRIAIVVIVLVVYENTIISFIPRALGVPPYTGLTLWPLLVTLDSEC